ncbi:MULTISPECIES: tRNA (5-methylaminomethyl-2-thiouridine)(34)-methyltransferase MnmD [unclassified Cellulophaga]|uniref:tRNA (5-methylaminomethyl-2-thiouridine)(34)-methyltransferase MnmD n=1 Tax=unclassified Cellulophaga TaxID=2634405 RepID=UPI0026E26775|nr:MULTISPECIES: tRNA (5-methylaminomethyl-2-thiouridine)(34)-methyltransferase MnmD [unclassified Cellulophaga]MDO6492931.1 tRNA (5-methylaminomethyl-2-thiouridine)(34)-methyltransferase MnmD [Cellulophaga sp. 2_MG-2023]MDO6496445.1 tRNA (5-methylaminomethyl-2-thiouridine)(34)-methyltransferase MnmD [Cellulophaga sp. 3_MG-2023]
MKRKIITTGDGSKTIQIEDWNEQYHSIHGAVQEAYHVFIKHGLSLFKDEPVSILEIGFGTGLNAIITALEAFKSNLTINYTGVEAYPVSLEEVSQLNYIEQLNAEESADVFAKMHKVEWEVSNTILPNFQLLKRKQDFLEITDKVTYNLIYFDAFGARVQPELWTETVFKIMYNALKTNGVLVTYAAKGSVRRAMLAVGFKVERLPGPPGKREMLRATKS